MRQTLKTSSKKIFKSLIFSSIALICYNLNANANYHLVIGSYRQGPGSKPHVSGITSPSLFSIPTKTLEQCEEAGKKINAIIYKPVWQFDNKWTCVFTGNE
tara:strand:+ start:111 stop:413 length:303 start_codon:yes stop_codon:yes gene_type:complete